MKLYKKDSKGNVREWCVMVKGSNIYIEHGVRDGKQQVKVKECEAKNVGRANERSPQEQATFEMDSLIKKQKDKGYVDNLDDIDNDIFLPMLAHDFSKRGKDITFPCLIQPKLDGVRCLVSRVGTDVLYRSRGGKLFTTLKHMDNYMLELLDEEATLDGEIYVHGWGFQRIVSALKAHNEDTEKLQFYAYDAILKGVECETRQALLVEALADPKWLLSPIKHTYTDICLDENKAHNFTRMAVEEGFEGAILRNMKGMYELNKRSKDLQKIKYMQDEEFKIVGFDKELVYDDNGMARSAIVYRCATKDKKRFMCRPRGTHEERVALYKDKKNLLGKFLTVQFQELTDEGISRFPVGISVRDYE